MPQKILLIFYLNSITLYVHSKSLIENNHRLGPVVNSAYSSIAVVKAKSDELLTSSISPFVVTPINNPPSSTKKWLPMHPRVFKNEQTTKLPLDFPESIGVAVDRYNPRPYFDYEPPRIPQAPQSLNTKTRRPLFISTSDTINIRPIVNTINRIPDLRPPPESENSLMKNQVNNNVVSSYGPPPTGFTDENKSSGNEMYPPYFPYETSMNTKINESNFSDDSNESNEYKESSFQNNPIIVADYDHDQNDHDMKHESPGFELDHVVVDGQPLHFDYKPPNDQDDHYQHHYRQKTKQPKDIHEKIPEYLEYYPHNSHESYHFDHVDEHDLIPVKPEKSEKGHERVNKRPYSYFYLAQKLWYVPLYFSLYFIIYIAALIIKSIYRHKTRFPNEHDWNSAGQDEDRRLGQKGHDIEETARVLGAIERGGKLYVSK